MSIMERGGCGLYARELIRGLLETKTSELSNLAVPRKVYNSIGNVKDIRFNKEMMASMAVPEELITSKFQGSFWHYLTLPLWEKKQGFDIFHDPAQIGGFTLRSSSKKILTIHDLSPLTHPALHPKERVLKHKYLLPRIISNTDLIVVPSNSTKVEVAELLDVDTERIMTIYPGCDHLKSETKIDFSLWKNNIGISSPEPFIILTVSTLESRKNIGVIVDAFDKMCCEDLGKDDIYLVIVGEWGYNGKELKNRIRVSPFRKNIIITGRIDDGTLAALYGGSSVFACMSLKEGFGLPPMEAQFFGLPTIISSDRALMEISGEGALVVKLEEGNERMAEELSTHFINIRTIPDLRKEMSGSAQRNASKYKWSSFTQNIMRAYRSVLG